jgi:hypothetical protein
MHKWLYFTFLNFNVQFVADEVLRICRAITHHFYVSAASTKTRRYRFFSELPVLPRIKDHNSY